jgi:hypothetical protein
MLGHYRLTGKLQLVTSRFTQPQRGIGEVGIRLIDGEALQTCTCWTVAAKHASSLVILRSRVTHIVS